MRGRVLLLSGSRGIAAATAKLAAQRGARVFLCSRSEETCAALEREIRSAGGGAGHLRADLTEPSAADRVVAACVERFGRIDALYNVAGISARRFGDGPLHECSDKGWELSFETNVTTAFRLSRATVRQMLAQERKPATGLRGAILHMSSIQALAPDHRRFDTIAYAASKTALLGLSQAMAAYYAREGIRVNAIAPAVVKTPLTKRAQSDPEILEYLRERQPLSAGLMDVEAVAQTSVFLLSDEARYITGEAVAVDGGWRAAR